MWPYPPFYFRHFIDIVHDYRLMLLVKKYPNLKRNLYLKYFSKIPINISSKGKNPLFTHTILVARGIASAPAIPLFI